MTRFRELLIILFVTWAAVDVQSGTQIADLSSEKLDEASPMDFTDVEAILKTIPTKGSDECSPV